MKRPAISPRIFIWSYIGLLLLSIYLPLVPPLQFSVTPSNPGGSPTLAWFFAIWRNPVLMSALITTLEVGAIVAVITPILGLAAAMAIRELHAPRLILALMLLPLF